MRPRAFPILLLQMSFLVGCTTPPAPTTALPAASARPAPTATAAPASATATPADSAVPSASAAPAPMMLVAAGDIADCTLDGGSATAALVAVRPEALVAALGDLVYPYGTDETYGECFMPTWGDFVERTRPAAGNHDLEADGGTAYWALFDDRAGTRGEGWYSYDIGEWHVVVLNSNCYHVGCDIDSAQHDWLVSDLAASDADCTLAYWHHPRFTSGIHGDEPVLWTSFWTTLADAGAELVLTGHDHHYERFAPMNGAGALDPEGLRQFIVGTGGGVLRTAVRVAAGSELIIDDAYGILELTLSPGSYAWSFIGVDGRVMDAGTGTCHP